MPWCIAFHLYLLKSPTIINAEDSRNDSKTYIWTWSSPINYTLKDKIRLQSFYYLNLYADISLMFRYCAALKRKPSEVFNRLFNGNTQILPTRPEIWYITCHFVDHIKHNIQKDGMPDKYTIYNSLESEKLQSAWNINLFQIEESDFVAEPITSSHFPEMLIKGEYCLFLL